MKEEKFNKIHSVRFKASEDIAIKKMVEKKKKEFDKYKPIDYIRECTVADLKKRGLLKN